MKVCYLIITVWLNGHPVTPEVYKCGISCEEMLGEVHPLEITPREGDFVSVEGSTGNCPGDYRH